MEIITLLLALQIANYNAILPPAPPPFDSYLASKSLIGPLALPRFVDEGERSYDKELREGVSQGYGVVDGGTEHERTGVNFGGHYVLVQWGCGSNCGRAALVDGEDGRVIRLPQEAEDDKLDFVTPTGSNDLRSLEFRWNSRLLGIPHISNGMTYYYVLNGLHWKYLKKVKTPDLD